LPYRRQEPLRVGSDFGFSFFGFLTSFFRLLLPLAILGFIGFGIRRILMKPGVKQIESRKWNDKKERPDNFLPSAHSRIHHGPCISHAGLDG
jgi:hypothetical protein